MAMDVLLQCTFLGMWFSAMDTCPAYFTEWLGLVPLQVVTCAAVVRPSCAADMSKQAASFSRDADRCAVVTVCLAEVSGQCMLCRASASGLCWGEPAQFVLCQQQDVLLLQVANAIFMMPRDTHDVNPVVQAMLQGLSWCEKHRSPDLASRNAFLSSQDKVTLRSYCACMPLSPSSNDVRRACRSFCLISSTGPLCEAEGESDSYAPSVCALGTGYSRAHVLFRDRFQATDPQLGIICRGCHDCRAGERVCFTSYPAKCFRTACHDRQSCRGRQLQVLLWHSHMQ